MPENLNEAPSIGKHIHYAVALRRKCSDVIRIEDDCYKHVLCKCMCKV